MAESWPDDWNKHPIPNLALAYVRAGGTLSQFCDEIHARVKAIEEGRENTPMRHRDVPIESPDEEFRQQVRHLASIVRPVRVDGSGRIFEVSGEQFVMPGLEPEVVLGALEDERSGRVHLLRRRSDSPFTPGSFHQRPLWLKGRDQELVYRVLGHLPGGV